MRLVDQLVAQGDPADAVADYYTRRTKSRVHELEVGREAACVIESVSPYGPVAVLRATDPAVVAPLLRRVTWPDRCYLMAPEGCADAVQATLRVEDPELNLVYSVTAETFRACADAPGVVLDGERAVARVASGIEASSCWTLWRSPRFAELAVATEAAYRGRGLGRACVSVLTAHLLEQGVQPVYILTATNTASARLCAGLGYFLCERREFAGTVTGLRG